MSTSPGESPLNDADRAFEVNGLAITQLSGRQLDQLTATVLQLQGYTDIAATIQARSGGLVSGVQAQPAITQEELVERHIPRVRGDNPYDKPNVVTRLAGVLSGDVIGKAVTPQPSNLTAVQDGASSQLLFDDPLNRQEAFRDLQAWVEGSLDMYKASIITISLLAHIISLATARVPATSVSHLCPFLFGPRSRWLHGRRLVLPLTQTIVSSRLV